MNVKKTLQNQIRGWFPQEPVLKAPQRTKTASVNRSRSFKMRRWLHGTSAFITSLLWRQRSSKFKIDVVLFGGFVLSDFFLLFLVLNNSVNFLSFSFGLFILMVSYSTLQWLISFYFKRREPYKKHSNISPNLRLGGIIIGVVAGAIAVYSYLSLLFVFSTPENPSTTPFYLGIIASLMLVLAFGLDMEWRKRNKLSPFNSV